MKCVLKLLVLFGMGCHLVEVFRSSYLLSNLFLTFYSLKSLDKPACIDQPLSLIAAPSPDFLM